MKLYVSAGTSSQAPHIAFREAGVCVELVGVDLRRNLTSDGADFTTINPLGYVPLLEFDDGRTLREVPAILLFAAEYRTKVARFPAHDVIEHLRLFEWLSFISSEIHQGLKAFERGGPTDADLVRERLEKRFAWIDLQLVGRPFLLGHAYSVADIYLWVLTNWLVDARLGHARHQAINLGTCPNLDRWRNHIAMRPAVKLAIETERQLLGSGR